MFYKIIIFKLFIIFVIIIENIYIHSIRAIKICLCTYGKKENRYIREFVEHYKKLGIDKIFLYDNNNIKGERFQEKINDYIRNKFVELINLRGVILKSIMNIYNHCYNKNKDKYDWLIYYEIDEFIFLKNYSLLKDYLKQVKFNKCDSILLNWVHLSDNNLIYYDNRTLSIRFTERGENVKKTMNLHLLNQL